MCQGRGIYLVRKFEDILLEPGDQFVAQRYMSKPYLIDGLKFDLRVYILVYGVEPLRVFVYKEGLARFATQEYVGPQKNNLDNLFMHLTNYAIQKKSDAFVHNEDADDDSGHKRSLTSILEYMTEHEPGFDAETMMEKICEIAVKTAISAQPVLAHAFKSTQPDDLENSMCFQILGLDIMIDQKLKPWLIEVNHLSSFGTDSPLDKKVKFDLIWDTLTLLNLSVKRKRK
jgi:tubulin polyglutamylase TTLL6/13